MQTTTLTINEVSAEDDALRVDLEYIDEGYSGYYQADDPQDEPLLRLTIYRRDNEGEWQAITDASYCTLIPATLPLPVLQAVATHILGMVSGEEDYTIEKIAERLSWLNRADCLGIAGTTDA